jgi:hypothetical protein
LYRPGYSSATYRAPSLSQQRTVMQVTSCDRQSPVIGRSSEARTACGQVREDAGP